MSNIRPRLTYALLAIGLFITFAGGQSALAQKTWIGGSGNAWETANNWSPSGVPGALDNVVINGGTGVQINYISATTIQGLTILGVVTLVSNAQLTISGSLTVGSTALAVPGTLYLQYVSRGGITLLVNGRVVLAYANSTIRNTQLGPNTTVTIQFGPNTTIRMANLTCYIGNISAAASINTRIYNSNALLTDSRFEGDVFIFCELLLNLSDLYLGQYSDIVRGAINNQTQNFITFVNAHLGVASVKKNVYGLVLPAGVYYPFAVGSTKVTEVQIRVNSPVLATTPAGEPWPWISVRVVEMEHPANTLARRYSRYWVVNTGGVVETLTAGYNYFEAKTEFHPGDIQGSPQNLYGARYYQNFEDAGLGQIWYPALSVQVASLGTGRLFVPYNGMYALGDLNICDPSDPNGPLGPVPVELTSFVARYVRNNVELNWQTATELNNFGFGIERSSDGDTWNEIDFVAGAGNSFSPRTYSYTDILDEELRIVPQIAYRLRQVDRDGTTEYSSIVFVRTGIPPTAVEFYNAYPNPFNPSTTISFSLSETLPVSIKVFNLYGQELVTLFDHAETAVGFHTVSFNGNNLPSGSYIVVLDAGGTRRQQRLVLSK